MSTHTRRIAVFACTLLVVASLLVVAPPNAGVAAGDLLPDEEEPEPSPAGDQAPVSPTAVLPTEEIRVVEVYVTVPVTETVYVEQVVPVTETVYVEQVVPVTETVYVEQVVPVTETVYVEEVVPITQQVVVTEVVRVEEVALVTQTVVVTETRQVEVRVPVTETRLVTETVQVEQLVPVTQTVVVTEVVEQVVPTSRTVYVTETVRITALVEQIVPLYEVVWVTQTVRAGSPVPTSAPAVSETVPTSDTHGMAPHLPVVASWRELRPAYWEQTPLPISGVALFYSPWVMDGVLRYRRDSGNIDECVECVGYVALLRAGDLNRRVWIQFLDGSYEGPFQVTDVAARGDIPNLLHRGWAVDVDWATAVRWGMQGGVPVTILAAPPVLIQ